MINNSNQLVLIKKNGGKNKEYLAVNTNQIFTVKRLFKNANQQELFLNFVEYQKFVADEEQDQQQRRRNMRNC